MLEWVSWFRELTFARPHYLDFKTLWLFGVFGLLTVLLLKRLFRPRYAKDSKQKLIGPDWTWILGSVLAGAMLFALAGPKTDIFRTVQSRNNLDIIVAVDKSASMAIRDVAPSRHEMMVRVILNLVGSSAVHAGDRLTLFAFSEKSNWRMPLSQDREEFADKLLEVEHPKDRIYYDRSQLVTYFSELLDHIPKALAMQDNLLTVGRFSNLVGWTSYPRVVLLFSDGDSYDSILDVVLNRFAEEDIRVYAVGIGTDKGGNIVVRTPAENDPSKVEPTEIYSRLNMETLDLIKDKTGGKSYAVSSPNSQVQSFLAAAVAENRKPTLGLVPTGEAKNFWWDFLAIPSLVLMTLMAIRLARY